jgi:hypothetical protein
MKKSAAAGLHVGFIAKSSVTPETRLSDPEFATQAANLKMRLNNDPEFARKMLRQAGIVNSKGRLAKSFGGGR